jgi:hypothetical protein
MTMVLCIIEYNNEEQLSACVYVRGLFDAKRHRFFSCSDRYGSMHYSSWTKVDGCDVILPGIRYLY